MTVEYIEYSGLPIATDPDGKDTVLMLDDETFARAEVGALVNAAVLAGANITKTYDAETGTVSLAGQPGGGGSGVLGSAIVDMSVIGKVDIYGPPATGKVADIRQIGVYVTNAFFSNQVTFRFEVSSSFGGTGYWMDPITLPSSPGGALWLFRPRFATDLPGFNDGEYGFGKLVSGSTSRVRVDVQDARPSSFRFLTYGDLFDA